MQARVSGVARGFTLIELMIGLVVLAVVIAIGLPGMQGLINSGRLSAAANELSAALQLTRVEALRRNRSVVLCRSETLAGCAAGDTWPGWLVFVDVNNNGVVDTGEEIIKTGTIAAPLVLRAS
ncbi:MAG: GspH/FimT family pseudopilin, partial [Proteobacteria bacterium]|nr:GspH/FimT family pseudopilin [Pseudomonadota bacterium]